MLAARHPEALVIGLDRSEHRLSKSEGRLTGNCLFLRVNCEDVWRLCVKEGLRFKKHYILYPNPYPKAEHLKRRWHGHSVFPELAELSEEIELRSNWSTYLEEFKIAWRLLTNREAELSQLQLQHEDHALTLFERKYFLSGQPLYQLIAAP